ncbi:hypothetical protein BDW68DRAFT_168204 [Aspergillus falconensis]
MDAVTDYEERRRIQNLLAQRKWRQKLRAKQRSASKSRQSLPDYHIWNPSSVPDPQTIYNQRNDDSQNIRPFECSLSSERVRPPDLITSPGAQNIGSMLMEAYLPEVDASSSPFYCEYLGRTTMNERDIVISNKHMENDLVFGSNQATGHNYAWQFPNYLAGQTANYDCWAPPAQNRVKTHNNGTDCQVTTDTIKNQIMKSIERAENLYEYGAMMQLFPPDERFKKHLADAKNGILSSRTGYQNHF